MKTDKVVSRYNLSRFINDSVVLEPPPTGESVEYTALAVTVVILALMGIFGNVPVLIVYFRRKDNKASNTFIKVLAFLDLLVCACVMPYTVVYEYHLVTSDVTCRLFEFLRHFSIKASNITLVAIAIERYVAVCRIGTKIDVKFLNKGVFGIFVISLLIASPSVGLFAVVNDIDVKDIPCLFPHEMTRGHFCHFTYTVFGEALVTTYQFIQMFLFFIILFIIIALYTIIYVVLWRKTKIRQQLTHRRECPMNVKDRHSSMLEKDARNDQVTPPQDSSIEREESSTTSASQTVQTTPTFNDASTQFPLKNENSFSVTRCRRASIGSRLDFRELNKNGHLEVVKGCFLRSRHNSLDISTGKYSLSGICKADLRVTFQPTISATRTKHSGSSTSITYTTKKERKLSMVAVCSNVDKPRLKRRFYHRRTAKMLFLCTVIYFVTWVPFWLDIFGLTNSRLLRYAFFIGNATNPIVYGIVNRQVRKQIKQLFVRCFQMCFRIRKEENSANGSISGTRVNV